MSVKSIPEWSALPVLSVPTVSNASASGTHYRFLKVGFLAVPRVEATAFGVDFPPPIGLDKVILPTATVEEGGAPVLYRLPLDLGAWVADNVALAQQGQKLFPSVVELAHLDGHTTADFV